MHQVNQAETYLSKYIFNGGIMQIKFEHTLDGVENYKLIFLLRNNQSMICPFNKNENEDEICCGSWCPHFDYDKVSNQVIISCAGSLKTYTIKEDKNGTAE